MPLVPSPLEITACLIQENMEGLKLVIGTCPKSGQLLSTCDKIYSGGAIASYLGVEQYKTLTVDWFPICPGMSSMVAPSTRNCSADSVNNIPKSQEWVTQKKTTWNFKSIQIACIQSYYFSHTVQTPQNRILDLGAVSTPHLPRSTDGVPF